MKASNPRRTFAIIISAIVALGALSIKVAAHPSAGRFYARRETMATAIGATGARVRSRRLMD